MTSPYDDDDGVETALNERGEQPTAIAAAFALTIVAGPDVGRRAIIDGSSPARQFVGKSSACDVALNDPHVSRRHAALDATPQGLRITDLSSRNGTFVNGVCVADAFLRGGETIQLGSTAMRVDLVGAPARAPLPRAMRFGRVFGASAEMRKLYPLCERLAATDVPLVIEGETGTGKELLAEALHESGPRASKPFVVFDCTAVPPNLVESHLFGHERGAFTTAVSSRKGVFEQADGGTLLIDEIGDLDPALQPKLLRALERSEVQRVGGDGWKKVDVRVMAATRRDLDKEVQAGRFREDLYYRLAVARIELPPLRARHGDIRLLARHFWSKLGGDGEIPEAVLAGFEDYAWPGNVRELRNAVARRVALGDLAGEEAVAPRPSAMPPAMSAAAPSAAQSAAPAAVRDAIFEEVLALDLPLPRARQRIVEEFERRYVERVLAAHNGNVTRAASASGIARRYFYSLRSRLAK